MIRAQRAATRSIDLHTMEVLATFFSQAKGIMFYDGPTTRVRVGDSVSLHLEPYNPHDSNCVGIWLRSSPPKMLGHLAREAAGCMAPLMRTGLLVSG